MNRVRRLILALALAGWALGALAAPALAKPPVWVVHGRGATVVLFGSVHVLPQGLDWRPEALDAALAEADELWFETPIDAESRLEVSRLALQRGLLPEGRSLAALLSPEGRARLARAEAELRLPAAELERLRPWLAELALGEAAYARDGATADEGVERQLAEAAPKAERRSFETGAQQVALFADAPEAEQAASLEDTLRELQEDPDQARRLIQAWMAGDLEAIDREGVQQLRRAGEGLFRRLVTDRNAAWLRSLRARLDAPPPVPGRPARLVVVVGVGHLAGSGGLPELLRRQGFRVDGPKG